MACISPGSPLIGGDWTLASARATRRDVIPAKTGIQFLIFLIQIYFVWLRQISRSERFCALDFNFGSLVFALWFLLLLVVRHKSFVISLQLSLVCCPALRDLAKRDNFDSILNYYSFSFTFVSSFVVCRQPFVVCRKLSAQENLIRK